LPTAHAAEATSYRFVPGDVIEISVPSHTGYDRTVVVRPDGYITFPIAGEVKALGLTAAELRARIEKGLGAELIRPQALISLKETVKKPEQEQVSVLGDVRSPQLYNLRPGWRMTEALAAAGGPLPTANLRGVMLMRAQRLLQTVDVSTLMRSGQAATTEDRGPTTNDPRQRVPTNDQRPTTKEERSLEDTTADNPQNPRLHAGDVIIVPGLKRPTVTVLGEVMKPSSYELSEGARILDALTQAGGVTPRADLAQAWLTPGEPTVGPRGGEPVRVDLAKLLAGDASLNRVLKNGDCLVVPVNSQRVYVLGEVNKPDLYASRPDQTALDVILAAGGPTREADLSRAVLVRRNAAGKPDVQKLSLDQLMKGASPHEKIALKEGDMIVVPGKQKKKSVGDYLNVLFPLSALRGLLF
jgi:polysaccharide export outer membrane protein